MRHLPDGFSIRCPVTFRRCRRRHNVSRLLVFGEIDLGVFVLRRLPVFAVAASRKLDHHSASALLRVTCLVEERRHDDRALCGRHRHYAAAAARRSDRRLVLDPRFCRLVRFGRDTRDIWRRVFLL